MDNIYTLEVLPVQSIDNIKDIWQTLEKGEDMTYFQSYDWNKMICHFTPTHKHVDCALYVVKKEGKAVMIAPLWIIRRNFGANKKGVYLIGRRSYSDYLSIIYDEFEEKAFMFLLRKIKEIYGKIDWYFEQIKEGTKLYDYIIKQSNSDWPISDDKRYECACLTLPESYDQYINSLTKNTRQNLRTAKNRLASDNIALEINTDNKAADPKACVALRTKRLSQKRVQGVKRMSLKDLIGIIRYKITQKQQISYPSIVPFIEDENSHLVTAINPDTNELAAFFCYGIDVNSKEVVVMSAGTNEKYAKYSPGMLCMTQLIKEFIESGTIRKVDFTRGGEVYKYRLGSKTHFIHDIIINPYQ